VALIQLSVDQLCLAASRPNGHQMSSESADAKNNVGSCSEFIQNLSEFFEIWLGMLLPWLGLVWFGLAMDIVVILRFSRGRCYDHNFSAILANFRRKKLAFFSKTNVMIKFLQK
jgi:hypothetical protein